MTQNRVYIIGIAPEGAHSLSPKAKRLINSAEIAFGGTRLLEMFPALKAEKVAIGDNLREIAVSIRKKIGYKRIVVLASGDPNFYGIARYLIDQLGKDAIEIIPNISAMQIAFARIKESWEDAVLTSVHSRPLKDVPKIVNCSSKIGILTDASHTPALIARLLIKHGIDNYKAYICENLGATNEKITEASLQELCSMQFSPINILILLRSGQKRSECLNRLGLFGIPDSEFYQRKPTAGLITKQEVRAISLSKMQLMEDSVLWDIGAGSGAVSIEAARLARKGLVYAVEKNAADAAIINKNLNKFNVHNVKLVHAIAPDNLDNLPDPNCVFIGGSGNKMKAIIDLASRKLKPGSHIVINIVSLENLNTAISALTAKGFTIEVTIVSAARSTSVRKLTRLSALNPVFIITGALKTNIKRKYYA